MMTLRHRPKQAPARGRESMTELTVNGSTHRVRHTPGATLLDVLRTELGLVGTKSGCGRGECGACTVLVDGHPTLACITLAARVREGVETVEGIAGSSEDLRAAFADTGAFQCGYCTPGQVVRAASILRAGVPHEDAGLRHQLSGNICRCTGYQAIVAAIRRAEAIGADPA